MPRATFVIEMDIDQDGTYGTTITSDVKSATIFRGRDNFMDAAQVGRLSLTMDNSAGKYSPQGASVVTENSIALTTLVPVRVRTTAPSTTTQFTGFITSISVDPSPGSQEVTIEANDSMVVLERAIISQRLMQSQATGMIINRLLDATEGEEHIDNPSFDEDLAGYTVLGTGTNTRVTTGIIMEGLAALESVTTASTSGWRYAIPHAADSEFQSKKVQASAYVWTALAADVGETFTLRLSDSAGAIATATITLSSEPQRVTVSGTFGAAATDFYLDGYMTSASATFRTDAVHCVNLISAIPRDIDRGDTRLSYYGPLRVPAMSAIDEVRDNELGGFFYINGGGTAVYEQRSARWLSTASLGTVDETFYRMDYTQDAEDRISRVSFTFGAPDAGAPATYIWELELPTSRHIAPNSTAVIWADYGYWAKDVTRPVANTDYRLNSQTDGNGTDMTGTAYGTFSWIPYGMGARFQFVNSGTAAYITQLALRATPIRSASDLPLIEYTPTSPPSLTAMLEHDYSLNDSKVGVESWANYLGEQYDNQQSNISVTLRPRTTALLQQMLSRNISDRVTLTNNDKIYSTGINGNYYIESIRHRIKSGGFLHETTWAVTPVDSLFWILGTGELGDAQTLTTTTALAP